MNWRSLLPSSWRDVFLPRLDVRDQDADEALPPWQGEPREARLESHRFEHRGAFHRAQIREHADGSGLIIVDACRIARLDARGLGQLRTWLAAGARDAASVEAALWGESVLTGEAPLRAANAWGTGARGWQPLPGIPLVATLDVPAGSDAEMVRRAQALHAWAIPHAIFRPESDGAASAVIAGVRAAEDLGLVAGVAGPGDVLAKPGFLEELAVLGLDHLAVPWAGAGAASHDAVFGVGSHARSCELAERAAALEIPLTGELPLVASNWAEADEILTAAESRGMLGVTAWALVDPQERSPQALAPRALRQVATWLERASDGTSLSVTWAAPAEVGDDIAPALGAGPRADGDFGLRVRADGTILPPRGSSLPAGQIGDPWHVVHESSSWQAFRRQAAAPTRCDECPGLALCAVDCPADPGGWA